MVVAQNKQEHNWQPVQRMFCLLHLWKKAEVYWFLMGDLKSEGIEELKEYVRPTVSTV